MVGLGFKLVVLYHKFTFITTHSNEKYTVCISLSTRSTRTRTVSPRLYFFAPTFTVLKSKKPVVTETMGFYEFGSYLNFVMLQRYFLQEFVEHLLL